MPTQISIVIPALNEAENLPELARLIHEAMAGRDYETIVVDDNSPDGTPAVAARLAEQYPLRLIVRTHPKDGLSGAVLHGIAEARGEYLVVMDADLQHPPAKIPELLAPLERGEAEFVMGSRYMPGGSLGERWGVLRKINSRIATILARPFAGRTTDPMSGFFALKRSTYARAQRLTPLGYKIALELMCKSRVEHVAEVPIHFAERTRGASKLTPKEQFRYLEHLSRLYDFTFPRFSPMIKFLIVLAVSWLVGLAIFFSLTSADAVRPVIAVGVGYLFAIAVTAVFHLRYVRTQREFIIRPRPWLDFALISAAELIVCVAVAQWVASRVAGPTRFDLFVISFLLATVVRYVLRKELLQDVRGLRKEVRKDELT